MKSIFIQGYSPCGSTNCISNQSITIMHPLKYPQIILRVLFCYKENLLNILKHKNRIFLKNNILSIDIKLEKIN